MDGTIKNEKGEVKYKVFGKWNSFLSMKNKETGDEIKLGTKY